MQTATLAPLSFRLDSSEPAQANANDDYGFVLGPANWTTRPYDSSLGCRGVEDGFHALDLDSMLRY